MNGVTARTLERSDANKGDHDAEHRRHRKSGANAHSAIRLLGGRARGCTGAGGGCECRGYDSGCRGRTGAGGSDLDGEVCSLNDTIYKKQRPAGEIG